MSTQQTSEPQYLTIAQASRLLPNRPTPSTIWRWFRRGAVVKGTGERVFLECRRFGGRLYVTREAMDAFGKRLAEADRAYFSSQPVPITPRRSPHTQEAEVEAAEQWLAKRGL